MSFNTTGAVQVGLELFGGLVTETPAMNLPAGVSPDCQDMAFDSGMVFSRPGLTKFLEDSLGSVTITYAKSYIDNQGIVRNLYLDSLGNLWMQNVSASLAPVIIGTVTPGSYAKSVTAFGTEYIAFSNGIHGTDVALQYDGMNLDRVTTDGPGTPPTIANVILPDSSITAWQRDGTTTTPGTNTVTVTTSAAHGLKVGYQAQVSGFGSNTAVATISTVVIDNIIAPGIATVTTTAAHGIPSGSIISLRYVQGGAVGGGILSATRTEQLVTIVMNADHNLESGAYVTLAGVTDPTFNQSAAITVVDNITFTFTQLAGANATSSGGTVTLQWPLPDINAENTFEVLAVPTSTTFQVAIAYSNGTFNNGFVYQSLDGIFYVASVPTMTTFTFFYLGPAGYGYSTPGAKVTPYGQAAPGQHQMQVLFLTRQDYVTSPSPPVKFVANGGQYLQVSNIPIGPPNVIARILAFTGADGAYFFYIPVPAQVNGQVVSTATQINDNTTTSVLLDFGDPTLFAATAINTQGNDLPNQIRIDSALGFAFFGNRLVTYGQRNIIQNLLNMSFDGGSIGAQITGWTGTATLATGHFSVGAQNSNISQGFYQDAYGAPIATPNAKYTARAWLSGTGATVTISSVLSGFTSTASLSPSPSGWSEAAFTLAMPSVIPTDLIITVVCFGIIDHLSIFYTDAPLINQRFYGSYVDNPEAFDGVSGKFGVTDQRKIMTCAVIRGALAVLTQDPSGRLHSIIDNGVTEPAGWVDSEVAGNCGALSAFCLTVSQADDSTAAGGEEWMAWMSVTGARIFGGDHPEKISQEIQPNWDQINSGAFLTSWALNDVNARRIYFGLPVSVGPGTATKATAPTIIMHVDYKYLDTAYEIAQSPPVHVSFSGKLAARDRARKWCPWNIPANGAAMLYCSPDGPLFPVFFVGNGFFPGTVAGGCGNVFALCSAKLTDDCLGQIRPYYTTYAFTSQESEQVMQLGGQRHMIQYLQWNATGVGKLTLTPMVDDPSNAWPITATLPLAKIATYDSEWGGGQASGQRFLLKFAVNP